MLSKTLLVSTGLSLATVPVALAHHNGSKTGSAAPRNAANAPHSPKTAIPSRTGLAHIAEPVERAATASPLLLSPAPAPAKAAAPSRSAPQTIRWETSFSAAQVRARREGKPILFLHLFGKLNETLC